MHLSRYHFVSSAFVHANVAHLSRNMFLVWLFGSMVQKEISSFGVWFTYLLCAVGESECALRMCCVCGAVIAT